MRTAIRFVVWASVVDMRRVRSEKISEPRSLNCTFTTQTPKWFVAASARDRSSPVSPRSASVKVVQASFSQVRSLNSSRAVWPMRALASSIPLVTSNRFNWPICVTISVSALP